MIETWRDLIISLPEDIVLNVQVVLGSPLKSASKPVLVRAEDDEVYYFKGIQNGRSLVSDHVVARIGTAMGAPVPQVAVLSLPQSLLAQDINLRGIAPGIGHGSHFIAHCGDARYIQHAHIAENRIRFQILAALFGVTIANDYQFIYRDDPPHQVFSVDHGMFLPEKGFWSERDLVEPGRAELDRFISSSCSFNRSELLLGYRSVAALTADDIAQAVAGIPTIWGVSASERASLAWFLGQRRDKLLASIRAQIEIGR